MKRRKRTPARTERIGMGRLISLKIQLENGRRVTWRFGENPILSFDRVTKDASGRGKQSRLYVDCGSYRITAAGKCLVIGRGKQWEVNPSSVRASNLRDYLRTHGGLKPEEITECPIRAVGRKRFVGWSLQMDYRADKATHGRVQYFHPLEPHAQPEVWVNGAGTQIYFRGGQYTVTPHGIEDIDR